MASQRQSNPTGGVIPSRLNSPARFRQTHATQRQRTVTRTRQPLNGEMGGTQDVTVVNETGGAYAVNRRTGRSLSIPKTGGIASTAGNVGVLLAEFMIAILMLILIFFAGSASYGDKIMSFMKRGSLTCLLFFILAIISSSGEGAAKVARVFGALIIVGLLLTSPTGTILSDLDALIKNDWKGTGEVGQDYSAASGTTSSDQASLITDVENAIKQEADTAGQKGATSLSNVPSTAAENALVSTLNGIIPGSGDILGKVFGI